MKKIIAAVLAAMLFASVCACSALATDEEDYKHDDFTGYTYYESSELTEPVKTHTIQLAASCSAVGTMALCDKLNEKGLDAFIVHANKLYYTMSGKFDNADEARWYLDDLMKKTKRCDCFIAEVELPAEAIEAFRAEYTPMTSSYTDDQQHYGYRCGQFFKEDKNEQILYAVQIVERADEWGAYQLEKQMLDLGYDAFLYEKSNGDLCVMCGKLGWEEDADAYCASIRANTGCSDAFVTDVYLPQWIIHEFEGIYYLEPEF